jgi:subfamily B ATP-binding cassette protein MsbA
MPRRIRHEPARDEVPLRERVQDSRPSGDEVARLLAFARPYTGEILVALVLLSVGTAAGLLAPALLAVLLDDVLIVGDPAALERLNRLSMLLVALVALRSVLTSAHGWLMARAGEGVVLDLRRKLYGHLVTLGPTFYDDSRVGALVSRVMNDVAQIQSVITSDLALLTSTVLTLIGAFGLLLWRSWRLTALILVLVPPVILIARVYGHRMRRYGTLYQDRTAETTAVVDETLSAIRLVQGFAREAFERSRFYSAAIRLYDAAMQRAQAHAVYSAVVSMLTFSALAVTLWFGGREVLAGRLTVGDLVAFVAYSSLIGGSASNLVSLYGRWSNAIGASRRVFELLDTEPAVADRLDAQDLEDVVGQVTFEGVSFSYGSGGRVLHDIELDVAPGEKLALVGPSGAGKTTMIHLISRFYDPNVGRLLVDGVDVRDLTLASLREHIGSVPQDTVLFNATVADNLRYGRLDATDDEVVEAARAAFAHKFICRLPDGYDTVVGERGVRLSAGERQRVAIARALLKDPKVLLLDEATSSLDSESERLVQAALERLMVGRTTIVIAHRLSTVRNVDRIAVVDQGRVVEVGSHDELVACDGLYARLSSLQFLDNALSGLAAEADPA